MNAILMIALLAILAGPLQASEVDSSTADSLLVGQQKLLQGQEQIRYQQTLILEEAWDDPFQGRCHGIEVNFAGLLVGSRDGLMLSGTYSYFPKDSNLEIAFPFFYDLDSSDENDLRRYALDFASRYYLGKHRSGIYVQAGLRVVRMWGPSDAGWWDEPEREKLEVNKHGVFTGVGYRKFSKKGLYWGCSISLGRYWGDLDTHLHDDGLLGDDVLFDIEFFKLGFLF